MVFRASGLVERGLPPPTSRSSSGRSIKSTIPLAWSARRFAGSLTTPPPQEMTCRFSLAKRAVCAASSFRKPASPSAAKMSGMLRPSALTISSSRSTNRLPSRSARARPRVDLPEEGIPMRAMFSCSRRSSLVTRAISAPASSNLRSRKNSAAYTACATSISRPPTATGTPSSSARRMSSVLSGL